MRSMIAKKEVRAPFDGQLGIRQVNVGQMINAGQQVVPLPRSIRSMSILRCRSRNCQNSPTGLEVRVRTDAVPGHEFQRQTDRD